MFRLSLIPSKAKNGQSSWKAERLSFNEEYGTTFSIYVFMELSRSAAREMREQRTKREEPVFVEDEEDSLLVEIKLQGLGITF